MNEEESRNDVLKLLGFTVTQTPIAKVYRLNRNDEFGSPWGVWGWATEAEAWAIAPSIEDLRSVLESVLDVRFREFTPNSYGVVIWKSRDVWIAEPPAVPLKYHGIKGTGETPSHAVMSLFVAACEAGLIDPKQVG